MLRLQGVSHAYGEIVSLRNVSLDVADGEILCLLGPSGCGKTTLLRIIAGLETKYEGVIAFNGDDIKPIPAHKRDFGMMFQDFALFPHLSVADNIAYGLKRLGLKREAIGAQVGSLLQRVGLTDLGEVQAALPSPMAGRVSLSSNWFALRVAVNADGTRFYLTSLLDRGRSRIRARRQGLPPEAWLAPVEG